MLFISMLDCFVFLLAHDRWRHPNKTLIYWRKQNICSFTGRRKTLEKFFPNKNFGNNSFENSSLLHNNNNNNVRRYNKNKNKNKKVGNLSFLPLKVRNRLCFEKESLSLKPPTSVSCRLTIWNYLWFYKKLP